MPRRCLFSTLALSLFLGNSNALAMESFDLHNINKVQQQGWTDNGVYVGVVDVNVQTDHPLLADNIAKVYSSTTWQPDKYPAYSFHGTHVAGILAATSTNGKSYGIATDAKLLINYMYANSKNTIFDKFPIKIINNSHTQGYGYFANYARKDVLNVFSSGNYGQMSPQANTMKGIGSNQNLGAWIIVGNLNRGGASRNANGKLVAQNLTNSGTTNIDAATNVAQDVNNKGTLNLGVSKPQTLTVGGKYSQGSGATLQLAFLADDSTNSKLTATNYDISGGNLVYAPLSASVLDRSIAFDLGNLSNYLDKFNTISLNSNGYALSYSLTSGRNGITITARPNVYADFSGANPSLASVLRLMSSANISNDYTTFFSTLNAADFATYRSALVDLNDLSHLQYNNLLLGIQNQDILDKVINLQTESEGVFLRPRYAHLKAGLKAHRAGFEFYANKNTSIGGFSTFINYDNLSGSDVSSQLVSLGTGLRNTTALPIGIFGGARLGFANNTVKKTQSLQYKTQSASLFAGVDKDFEFAGEVHFIPTFYVNYHYFHQENFHHAGISYRGTAFFNRLQTNGFNGNNLFARNIHAKNSNFASANLGLTFKQNLAQFWNLGIHGFYERRLLGDKFKTSAQLSDFGGDFEQSLKISQNFFRLGLNLNYELPMNAKGIGYFASVGVDYETSSNGTDRYRAYGADFKGGIKF